MACSCLDYTPSLERIGSKAFVVKGRVKETDKYYLKNTIIVVKSITISAYKTMFGSSLPHVACRRARVLFTLFVLVCK